MAEFIFIAPAGWSELDLQFVVNNTPFDINRIKELESTALWYELDEGLKEVGLVPEGKSVSAAKIVEDTYLWVLFE